jgi:hypothetical protein
MISWYKCDPIEEYKKIQFYKIFAVIKSKNIENQLITLLLFPK